MDQLKGDGATREQLIRRCMQEMWWLLQPAVVQEQGGRREQEQAPREEEAEGGEEVDARGEEVEGGEEELEQEEEEMEARGLNLEDNEEESEEEGEGTEAQENSALQSSSHSSHEDPLEEISLEEIEQQTLYTQESVQFSEQLQKEHREYEMQLQSKEPTESTGFYFNLEAEFRWQQNLFPSFQFYGESDWYGEGAGIEQTGEFNGSHSLNQHNHF